LTVIVGKNGAGKSTILDALSFVLFNKPFRKINKPQLVNSITKKNCVVETIFSIGKDSYKVIRGIKPAIFEIYKNETLLPQDARPEDYQNLLERNILRCNAKTFSQVVVLGSASYIPFLDLPAQNRREVVENILDLELFTKMNTILKKKALLTQDAITELTNKKILLEDRINIQNENLRKSKDFFNKQIEENKEKYVKTKIEIEYLESEMRQNHSTKTSIDYKKETELVKNSKEKYSLINQCKSRIKTIEEELVFYEQNDNCPVCKQILEMKFKEETVADKKKMSIKIQKAMEKLQLEYDDILVQFEIEKKLNNEYNENVRILDLIKFKIDHQKKILVEIVTRIENLEKERGKQFVDETENLDKELENTNQKIDCLLEQKKNEQTLLRLLKDDGIKAKIIEQYIGLINDLVNNYLLEMDFLCQFILDGEFNETIKSRYRDDFTYASFSEGEKLRITLAILFTWREVAKRRNSVSTNILFFDEILDSSLDGEGIETFLQIINNLTKGVNTFIISHNDKSIEKINNVIEFKKIKGFSQLAYAK
jgi:DNA repair exonuclease SbcCD ATPase subunit